MGDQPFEERIEFARKMFGKDGQYASMERIKVLPQEEVRDRQHVLDKLKEIESLGGEGAMLRKPKSYVISYDDGIFPILTNPRLYERMRSNTLLKVKVRLLRAVIKLCLKHEGDFL